MTETQREERERVISSRTLLRIAGLLTDYRRSVEQVERAQDDAAKRAGEIGQRRAHKEILDEIRAQLLRVPESIETLLMTEENYNAVGRLLKAWGFVAAPIEQTGELGPCPGTFSGIHGRWEQQDYDAPGIVSCASCGMTARVVSPYRAPLA